jgi:hypothetical protein
MDRRLCLKVIMVSVNMTVILKQASFYNDLTGAHLN